MVRQSTKCDVVSMVATKRYETLSDYLTVSSLIFLAAVIRDTLYIDGGALAVSPGLNDGTYGELITNG